MGIILNGNIFRTGDSLNRTTENSYQEKIFKERYSEGIGEVITQK